MDLPTLFKEYPAVVNAVVGLIGIFLGFFLGRWNTKESRDFTRRAEIHDMRIREARDYIDTWADYADFMWFIQISTAGKKDRKKLNKDIAFYEKQFPELAQRVGELSKKGVSLNLLNDAELTNLKEELIMSIHPLTENVEASEKLPLEDRILEGKTFELQNMTSEEFINIKSKVYKIVTKMKARLDRLSKGVPK